MLVLFVDSGCTRFAVMGETLQTDLVGWSLWSLGPSPQPPNVAPPLCLAHLSAMVHGPAHGSLPIPLEGFPKQQGLLSYWTCIPHHHKKLNCIEQMQQNTEQVLPPSTTHHCHNISSFGAGHRAFFFFLAFSSFFSPQHRGGDMENNHELMVRALYIARCYLLHFCY